MLARVFSCAVIGLEGVIVEVEVDTGEGLPAVAIVGLPDAAVQESRERVQAAIRNAGLYFPRKRMIVNLAPAAVRKEGPAYDLPIALGALMASGQISCDALEGSLVIGELSLDGAVRHVRGVLPMAALARQQGDWEAIHAFYQEALGLGLYPNDSVEWMPFVQAYTALGDLDKLRTLKKIIIADPYLTAQTCQILTDMVANSEIRPEIQKFVQNSFCE